MSGMRLSRDMQLAIGLLLVLLFLMAVSIIQDQRESNAPLSSRSSDPDGALALSLWLKELGNV